MHICPNWGRLNMLMVHDGRNMRDVPIEVIDNWTKSPAALFPIKFLRGLENIGFEIGKLFRET
ncbi:MAG: hypothetical protein LVQ95_04140 [Candidatus Micrarchaeales archaeon]|nr:hypothetical protein [Candidatus Micrarchaeales archaeon]